MSLENFAHCQASVEHILIGLLSPSSVSPVSVPSQRFAVFSPLLTPNSASTILFLLIKVFLCSIHLPDLSSEPFAIARSQFILVMPSPRPLSFFLEYPVCLCPRLFHELCWLETALARQTPCLLLSFSPMLPQRSRSELPFSSLLCPLPIPCIFSVISFCLRCSFLLYHDLAH